MHGDGCHNGTLCGGRDAWIDRPREQERVGVEEPLLGIYWGLIGQQVVECSAKRVNVGTGIGVAGIPTILLQRGIGHGAPALQNGDGVGVVRRQQFDQPEVHQFNQSTGRQLDVGRLDVAVEYGRVLAVEILQRITQLIGPAKHQLLVEEFPLATALLNQVAQVRPTDEVHHQVLTPTLAEGVGDLGQVGVVQPRQGGGLAAELLLGLEQRLWRGVRVRADLLDRTDATFQAQVLGAVYCPHTPLADRRNDFVPSTQDGLGCKQADHVFSSSLCCGCVSS